MNERKDFYILEKHGERYLHFKSDYTKEGALSGALESAKHHGRKFRESVLIVIPAHHNVEEG